MDINDAIRADKAKREARKAEHDAKRATHDAERAAGGHPKNDAIRAKIAELVKQGEAMAAAGIAGSGPTAEQAVATMIRGMNLSGDDGDLIGSLIGDKAAAILDRYLRDTSAAIVAGGKLKLAAIDAVSAAKVVVGDASNVIPSPGNPKP